jgi:Flp pilus assembly protein TadG
MSRGRPGRPPAAAGRLRRFGADRRGAAAVEFAFVAPVVILMIVAAVDVGIGVYRQVTLANAAKETVRYAAVRGAASGREVDTATLEQWARDNSGLAVTDTTATATWTPDRTPGATVAVAMQHTYRPMTLMVFEGALTLSAEASMVITR